MCNNRYQRVCFFDVIEESENSQRSGVINEDMATYADPAESKPVRFYLLPNVHRSGCRGRPIVTAVGSPTDALSKKVDHFI